MWSEGLGNVELQADGKKMNAVREAGSTLIKGVTDEPVQWEFVVTLEKEDLKGVLHLIFKYRTLLFFLKHIKQVVLYLRTRCGLANRKKEAGTG
ncbi:MAG: hypothetical protein SWH61_11730 [Thermodesulfobacteriota bacterium]|nr:hypothetical protein [Thermodesulfobacteriota bacterium]